MKVALRFSRALAAGTLLLTAAPAAVRGRIETVELRVDPRAATPVRAPVRAGISLNPVWLVDRGAPRHILTTPGVVRLFRTLRDAAADQGERLTLRIGGIGNEYTYWTPGGEELPPDAQGRITRRSLAALATLARAADLDVVLTVNFAQYARGSMTPARAADQVAAAKAVLGPRLRAVAIGNEPSLEPYLYDPNHDRRFEPAEIDRYSSDWSVYRDAILARTPGTVFYGPSDYDIDDHNAIRPTIYEGLVAKWRATGTRPPIRALTYHAYAITNCVNPERATIAALLSDGVRDRLRSNAARLARDAAALGVLPVYDERNSSSCAGSPGVSNTHAAALWALDAVLLAAREGVTEQNFHSMLGRCGDHRPRYGWYTPFCAPSDAASARGELIVQPIFYGLLAANMTGGGSYLDVTGVPDGIRAHVIRHGERPGAPLTIVLINTRPASRAAQPVRIALDGRYRRGERIDLAVRSGGDLASVAGVALGGDAVVATERFAPVARALPVSGDRLALDLPSASAALIRLR